MENKVNYYKKSLEIIKNIGDSPRKPKLLLHSCCGPCATFPLTFLCPIFNVTIFFNNSNIYPSEEYYRRLNELKRLLEYYKRDYGYEIGLIETQYNNEKYNVDLEPFKDQPEGQNRCFICYEKRMDEAFEYADKNGFDYFTTVMTISRQKDSQILNKIGQKISQKYHNTKYFYSDFKKNKGIDIGRDLKLKYGLYQQLYCGCKYTYEKGLIKAKEKENEEICKKSI